MSRPSSPSFSDIGLPDGHAFPELVYHHATGSIVAHTRPRESRLPSHRLSIRTASESRYRVIGDFPPAISVASFAICQTQPLLYFVTFCWSERDGHVGGDWDALYRFALDTRQSEVVARRGELMPPEHYHTAWLTRLHSIADDGSRVFCTAALRRAEEPIDYCLCELSVAERKLATITKLEAVFA
jgi:hypothetical protein